VNEHPKNMVMDGDGDGDVLGRDLFSCVHACLAYSLASPIPNITPEKGPAGGKKGWIILRSDKRRTGEGIRAPPMRNVLRQPHQAPAPAPAPAPASNATQSSGAGGRPCC
jgi:hypothetical protein